MQKNKKRLVKIFAIPALLLIAAFLLFVAVFGMGSKVGKQNIESARRQQDLSALLEYAAKAKGDLAVYAFVKALEIAKLADQKELARVVQKRPELTEYYNLFLQENDMTKLLLRNAALEKTDNGYALTVHLHESAKGRLRSLTYKSGRFWKTVNFFKPHNRKLIPDEKARANAPVVFSAYQFKGKDEIHINFTSPPTVREFALEIVLARPGKRETVLFAINTQDLTVKRIQKH